MTHEQPRNSWLLGAGRQWLLLAADGAIAALGLSAAYVIRFDPDGIPPDYLVQLRQFLPLLVVVRMASIAALGLHRWSFHLAGLAEAVRLLQAGVVGSLVFFVIPLFLGVVGPPRSVVLLEFLITTAFFGALRFFLRAVRPWVVEKRRAQAGPRTRAIIVGAGSTGELLLRDLLRSDDHGYRVVGLVDDDRSKWGTTIGGRPVLGGIDDLPTLVSRRQVEELLLTKPTLPASRIRDVLSLCADMKLRYKNLPVSFSYLHSRISPILLRDLAPEDLLSRESTSFDPEELRAIVEGRSVFVTGAAGSIGGEIARQLVAYRPGRLVLSDINENDLYLLWRELEASHPAQRVEVEVADIRERHRIMQLGRDHSPAYVFHAAAHKQVPLMELAPEEAVKNNIIGTRHVLEMAEEVGAERFVLISTDKAVQPSSAMGASKRVTELMLQGREGRSPLKRTAVRFGNVLGTAGSVVPLFKTQIARGGPVTVTHPECRRYLMTIREAVELVLRAGLNDYGELCLLDMGEPILILDIARHMITLSGQIPDKDVAIVFTGLRAGEKLDERLASEEELRNSKEVVAKIRVLEATAPPPGFADNLTHLEAAAMAGDRPLVLRLLQSMVLDYSLTEQTTAVTAPEG